MTERPNLPEPYVFIPGTEDRDRKKKPTPRVTDAQGKVVSLGFPARKVDDSARSGRPLS